MDNTSTVREYEGTYGYAKVFSSFVEEAAEQQILTLLNQPMFENSTIRIMPDVHAGAGCVIGFTAKLTDDKIIPNLVGVDIGCGVMACVRKGIADDIQKIEDRIDFIPTGTNVRPRPIPALVFPDSEDAETELREEILRICKDVLAVDPERHLLSVGSLGGGNHFIEVNRSADGNPDYDMVTVHSGSRNFGLRIATHYQNKAIKNCANREIPKELAYLTGADSEEYLRDMRVAQRVAHLNRKTILSLLLNQPVCEFEVFDTVHNYISEDMYLRKGAVSAEKDELFVLPINMAHGSYIMRGKGNADYNYSAPHGAGRIMGRKEAKRRLDMDEFRAVMKEHGVRSSCVSEETLDEAPMAYKDPSAILQCVGDTAEVVRHMKSVYNFKATT